MTGSGYELELKFLLSYPPALETRLQALRANLVHKRVHEINLRFDTPDGALTSSSQVLRLRQDYQARITYKGPSETEGGVRKRREIEFTVGDYQAAQALLEALGYQVSLMYEKYRTSYEWERVQIVLDEMPYGTFAEIEGSTPEQIRAVSDRLNLDWSKGVLDSYTVLFDKLRAAHGFTFRDLSFANFANLQADLFILGISPADL